CFMRDDQHEPGITGKRGRIDQTGDRFPLAAWRLRRNQPVAPKPRTIVSHVPGSGTAGGGGGGGGDPGGGGGPGPTLQHGTPPGGGGRRITHGGVFSGDNSSTAGGDSIATGISDSVGGA